MWQSSLKFIPDLGSKERCEQLQDEEGNQVAMFTVDKLNATDIRAQARIGICLPKSCSQDDF